MVSFFFNSLGPYEESEGLLQAAEELPLISQSLQEMTEYVAANRVCLVPLNRAHIQTVREHLKCAICMGAYATV